MEVFSGSSEPLNAQIQYRQSVRRKISSSSMDVTDGKRLSKDRNSMDLSGSAPNISEKGSSLNRVCFSFIY